MTSLDNFERAFSCGGSSIRMQCACGREFYDTTMQHCFDKGEFEELLANKEAVGLDYSPSEISFEGSVYVSSCQCWKPRAETVINFISSHGFKIASFLKLEKRRKTEEAEAYPAGRGWSNDLPGVLGDI